jgi:hypothetical protein
LEARDDLECDTSQPAGPEGEESRAYRYKEDYPDCQEACAVINCTQPLTSSFATSRKWPSQRKHATAFHHTCILPPYQ